MELEFGPFLRPKVSTTLTKRLLYWILLFARPVFFFFFSPASTFGVWPLTFPARAREPWTFPPFSGIVRSIVWFSNTARFTSSSSGAPEQNRFSCSQSTPSSMELSPQTGYVSLWGHVQHVRLVSIHNQLHRGDKTSLVEVNQAIL